MDLIRVWKEMDIDEVESHIVILDDIQGFCPACKKTGIKFDSLAACPSCGREFRYAALRDKGDSHAGTVIFAKIAKTAPHLIVVDNNDYNAVLNRKKTKSLFKGIGE